MNQSKKENSFWLEILRNMVFTIIFLAVYDLKLFLAPHTSSEMLRIAFILFCANVPTFLKMYLKKEKTNDDSESYSNNRGATVEEKIEAAKEVKEILTVPISIKTWIFVASMGYLSYWYFLRNTDKPTIENIFTTFFLGVFFALVFIGLYKIIQDEKEK
jgi:hypothetical protein